MIEEGLGACVVVNMAMARAEYSGIAVVNFGMRAEDDFIYNMPFGVKILTQDCDLYHHLFHRDDHGINHEPQGGIVTLGYRLVAGESNADYIVCNMQCAEVPTVRDWKEINSSYSYPGSGAWKAFHLYRQWSMLNYQVEKEDEQDYEIAKVAFAVDLPSLEHIFRSPENAIIIATSRDHRCISYHKKIMHKMCDDILDVGIAFVQLAQVPIYCHAIVADCCGVLCATDAVAWKLACHVLFHATVGVDQRMYDIQEDERFMRVNEDLQYLREDDLPRMGVHSEQMNVMRRLGLEVVPFAF